MKEDPGADADDFPILGPQDHVGAVGTTRCGKTTLLKRKVADVQSRVLVVDTKMEDWNHLPVVKWDAAIGRIRRADFVNRNHTKARFRWRIAMGVGEKATENADAFAFAANKHLRNVTIIWDEIGAYTTSSTIPDGIKVLITQGGGRDLRFVWGTQRPTMVHADIYNQTAHLFVFHIKTKDRAAVKKYFPYYLDMADEVPYRSYRFIYESPDGQPHVMGPI